MTQPASLRRAHGTARALLAAFLAAALLAATLTWHRSDGHPPASHGCQQGAFAAGDAMLRRADQIQTDQAQIQADLDRRLLAAAAAPDPAGRRARAAAAVAAARASTDALDRASTDARPTTTTPDC